MSQNKNILPLALIAAFALVICVGIGLIISKNKRGQRLGHSNEEQAYNEAYLGYDKLERLSGKEFDGRGRVLDIRQLSNGWWAGQIDLKTNPYKESPFVVSGPRVPLPGETIRFHCKVEMTGVGIMAVITKWNTEEN